MQYHDRHLAFVRRQQIFKTRTLAERTAVDQHLMTVLEQHAQPPVDEIAARRQQRFPLITLHHAHRHPLCYAMHVAIGVRQHGLFAHRRIQAEDENLLLVDQRAFIRQRFKDRRTAGGKFIGRRPFEPVSGKGQQIGLEGKTATQARGQVAREIVDPVLLVRPTARARLGAIDYKGFGQARIAESHHRFREPYRDLTHALDLALRRERLHLRRERGSCGKTCDQSAPTCFHSSPGSFSHANSDTSHCPAMVGNEPGAGNFAATMWQLDGSAVTPQLAHAPAAQAGAAGDLSFY